MKVSHSQERKAIPSGTDATSPPPSTTSAITVFWYRKILSGRRLIYISRMKRHRLRLIQEWWIFPRRKHCKIKLSRGGRRAIGSISIAKRNKCKNSSMWMRTRQLLVIVSYSLHMQMFWKPQGMMIVYFNELNLLVIRWVWERAFLFFSAHWY